MIAGLRRLPVLLLAFAALPATAQAHRLDEYLQATLVDIEPGEIRLQISLTPGVAVAEQVLAIIDQDHDGVISASEAAAYAELLKRDLIARTDRRAVELKLIGSSFPAAAELRDGWGIIQLEYSIVPGSLGAGAHKLTLESRHMPAIGAYLLNATQPKSASIKIASQKRNENQSFGEIEFTLVRQSTDSTRAAVGVAALVSVVIAILFAAVWRPRKN